MISNSHSYSDSSTVSIDLTITEGQFLPSAELALVKHVIARDVNCIAVYSLFDEEYHEGKGEEQ